MKPIANGATQNFLTGNTVLNKRASTGSPLISYKRLDTSALERLAISPPAHNSSLFRVRWHWCLHAARPKCS